MPFVDARVVSVSLTIPEPSQSRRTAKDAVTQGDRRLVSGECQQGQQGLCVCALERLIDGPVDALGLRSRAADAGAGICGVHTW
jgi:hypothetical protein